MNQSGCARAPWVFPVWCLAVCDGEAPARRSTSAFVAIMRFLPLLSFTAYITTRAARACPPPPSTSFFFFFKWRGASWVLRCLAGVSRGIWWVKEATQTTIPRMPRGPIKVSDYTPLEGEGREEGLPAAAVATQVVGGSDSD